MRDQLIPSMRLIAVQEEIARFLSSSVLKKDTEFYHKTTFVFALISTCQKPNSRDLDVSETCDIRVI